MKTNSFCPNKSEFRPDRAAGARAVLEVPHSRHAASGLGGLLLRHDGSGCQAVAVLQKARFSFASDSMVSEALPVA
eukprot:scaffold101784_cov38-Prasinocladus_malaysianus.AAC.1